ncbi:MAG TPA: response regulator [Herpetosiphonaceae bacterium]
MATRKIDPQDATVFVVEDNPDNLFMFSDILRGDVGVRSCHARASGQQLLRYLVDNPEHSLDLILLDLAIPYEDGFIVHQKLREFFRNQEQQPYVIAVTANCLPETVERAQREGFDGFIGKPIDRGRFIQQINRILQGEPIWEPH